MVFFSFMRAADPALDPESVQILYLNPDPFQFKFLPRSGSSIYDPDQKDLGVNILIKQKHTKKHTFLSL